MANNDPSIFIHYGDFQAGAIGYVAIGAFLLIVVAYLYRDYFKRE